MRRARQALVLVSALFAVVACSEDDGASPFATATTEAVASTSTARAGQTSGPTTSTGPPVETLAWEECGFGTECATLAVPLDYAEPDGATIDLALARRPADRPNDRLGTIVVNPGGPGGSGVELVTSGFSVGGDVDARFDLVSWDPRGVGDSEPVRCGGSVLDDWLRRDPNPDSADEQAALHDAARRLADECAAVDGDLLAHVSTLDAVEDLERIRTALGEDQIRYLGLSYGTFIGQLYLEAHPDRVGGMVLDGVMDPADPLASLADAQAGGFEGAFEEMAAWCRGASNCPLDDPLAAYDQLADRVEDEPIPGGSGTEVGPAELQVGTEAALYSRDSWGDLAAGLADALEGDGEILAYYVDSYYGAASFTAYAAVVCLDFGPPDVAGFDDLADELEARHPRFGAGLGYELLPCAYWPEGPRRAPAAVEGLPAAPPILSIASLRDPATPISEAIDVAARLDGELLRFDSDGHVAIHESDCVDGWIEGYFLAGTLPPAETVC